MRLRLLLASTAICALAGLFDGARADKIDDLTRALMQDPSYKVRVQAALVLGKLNDRRAVPALMQALKDENESVRGVAATSLGRIGDRSAANALLQATNDPSEFVRAQAKKALELVAGGGGHDVAIAPRAGAKFYLAVGFQGGGKGGPQYNQIVREQLARELSKLPAVTLSVGGGSSPSAQLLSQNHLRGYYVDGNIQRLSSSNQGGQSQIDCDLKAFVATYPDKSIKMMATEGASLQGGGGPGDDASAKKDCLAAAVEAVREDVGKFLRTLE
ncbi:MAG TPA: HEAT repeat domain-containing protein [Polyangia bacterium]|nr:HEAT repeat domain-containing protein [Polyangia bacterium]